MGECCPLLYLSGNHFPLLMIYTNKMVTLKKRNTKIYWYEQYIEKKVSCCNKCSVYRSDWNCMMYDLWNTFVLPHDHVCTVFTRWSEHVRRVNKILWSFLKHCYILLNFVLFFSISWHSVTISSTHVTTEHENKSS